MSSRPPSGPSSRTRSVNGNHAADHDDALNHNPFEPTYHEGIIYTTLDAFIILQNCLEGRLTHVSRRPADKEREASIASGHIFCYEENASGIKRWTDGVSTGLTRLL